MDISQKICDNRYSVRTLKREGKEVQEAENPAHIYTREPERQDQYSWLCNTKEMTNIHDSRKHDSYMTHNLTHTCVAAVSSVLTHIGLC